MAAFRAQQASATSLIASVSATFSQTPTQGNLLVAAVTSNVAVGSMAISGWSTGTSIAVGVAGGLIIFYKVAGVAESTTVTATGTLATFMDLHIYEYDGIDNATPLDKTSSTADGGSGVTSRASGTTATLTQANELAFAAVATAATNGGLVSWSNSYNTGITTTDLLTADLITTVTTATSSTATWNTSQRAAGAIVTFFGETGDSYSPKIPLKPRTPIINWNNPLTKGLFFAIPIFERGGTTTQERISKINDSLVATPAWGTDISGSNLTFDGTSQYINIGTLGNFGQNLINPFTVAVWLKTTTSATARTLIGSVNTGTNTLFQIQLNQKYDGTNVNQFLNFQLRNEGGTTNFRGGTTNAIAFNDGNLHLIIFSINPPAASASIYFDGVSQATTMNLTNVMTGTANFGFPLTVMARNNRATIDTFIPGSINSFLIWNRLLNAQEAKQLYTNPWQIYTQPKMI